jgi:hypothetical protein
MAATGSSGAARRPAECARGLEGRRPSKPPRQGPAGPWTAATWRRAAEPRAQTRAPGMTPRPGAALSRPGAKSEVSKGLKPLVGWGPGRGKAPPWPSPADRRASWWGAAGQQGSAHHDLSPEWHPDQAPRLSAPSRCRHASPARRPVLVSKGPPPLGGMRFGEGQSPSPAHAATHARLRGRASLRNARSLWSTT